MEKVNWKVEGMSCTNCALSIHKYLEKEGLKDVKVNFASAEVSFNAEDSFSKPNIIKGIKNLGYEVVTEDEHGHHTHASKGFFKNNLQRFYFCSVFTLPLLLHMIIPHHVLMHSAWLSYLMNPWVQFALCLPVYIVGMNFFGRSAFNSLTKGIPNMNVLITIGATAAFLYSLIGTLGPNPEQYLYYETAATILTLVFWGEFLEHKSVQMTQEAVKKLTVSQKIMANMIAFDDKYQEQIFPIESTRLKVGDLILIKNGEYVPMDCKILWGNASVDESIITGESVPVDKKQNDKLIGGSILNDGTVKAYVTAVGEETVMSHILRMVKEAQSEKPPVQQLADKISAIFVPAVLSIALLTFIGNYTLTSAGVAESLMRSIAVLVIACPCAMGLATPAAVAVGLGRGAKHGILFKNAKSLEIFKDIKQVVFDKTGTLTTGKFTITAFSNMNGIADDEFKRIAFSLEKYSNHPVAKAVALEWKTQDEIRWQKIQEEKGLGMIATDKDGNTYSATSYKKIAATTAIDHTHSIYVTKNNELIGWIDVKDDLRKDAKAVVNYLHAKGIKTVLLSGDKKEKCVEVANALGIDEVIAEQTPEEKLLQVERLNKILPTAMVGDGINDAPALAKATVGVSLSDATQVAMQSAQVILMHKGLENLPLALGLGKHTYKTIKSNLFWAFAYNITAIPIAALGLLGKYGPTYGALIMGLSDVVLAINSLWLKWKKVV